MTLFLPNGRLIRLSQTTLGGGAEGKVFRLEDTPDLCAKIYLDPTTATHDRLVAMMRASPATWRGDHAEHMHVAWPQEILRDESGLTRGFLMPLIEGEPLTHLFDPRKRLTAVDGPTWRMAVTVAARVARLLAMLHDAGIVVGDLSPTNLVLSRTGHVTLVDCDTVQFTDLRTNQTHRCTKLTPEYAPPELGGAEELLPSHDNFGLAILVCQLLMEGEHPFEGVSSDSSEPDRTPPENIQLQSNRILFPERFRPVKDGMPLNVLPPQVLEHARACFGNGHHDSAVRPSARDWASALDQTGFQLMGCRENEHHLYHNSLEMCIWCAKRAAGHGDHYPPPAIPPVVIRFPIPAPAQQPVGGGAWLPAAPKPVPVGQSPPAQPRSGGQPQAPKPRTGGLAEVPLWLRVVIVVAAILFIMAVLGAVL